MPLRHIPRRRELAAGRWARHAGRDMSWLASSGHRGWARAESSSYIDQSVPELGERVRGVRASRGEPHLFTADVQRRGDRAFRACRHQARHHQRLGADQSRTTRGYRSDTSGGVCEGRHYIAAMSARRLDGRVQPRFDCTAPTVGSTSARHARRQSASAIYTARQLTRDQSGVSAG